MSLIRNAFSCNFLFLLLFSPRLYGQINIDDSIYYQEAIANAEAVYFDKIGTQAAWMNGRMNIPYSFPFEKGSPYFNSPQFEKGTLVYEGITYQNIPLLYDELSTTLISFCSLGRIELPKPRVDGFTINGYKFIKVKDPVKGISPGYYQQIYSGKVQVLKKNKKEIKEDLVSGTGIVRSIEERKQYFLLKNNTYYSISGKKDLVNSLGDHGQEIRVYIKKQKLKWKTNAERLIAEVAAYYDQLTK